MVLKYLSSICCVLKLLGTLSCPRLKELKIGLESKNILRGDLTSNLGQVKIKWEVEWSAVESVDPWLVTGATQGSVVGRRPLDRAGNCSKMHTAPDDGKPLTHRLPEPG